MNIILAKISRWSLLFGLSATLLAPNLVKASGFALIENSASGQGNAYAGAAAHARDGSTVWFNPAGMTKLDRDQLVFAGHIVAPNASFTNNGSLDAFGNPLTGPNDDGGSTAFVPNFYWVASINDSTKFGLGVTVPFGLRTEYGDNWVGRYHGVVSDLKTININPSVAYQINDKVSIGGGLNIMYGTVELSSAVDFGAICVAGAGALACGATGASPQGLDGFADLNGDNTDNISTGFNLGLTLETGENTTLGLAYRSEVEMKVRGTANFTVPNSSAALNGVLAATGAFVDTGISSTVDLPASFSVSASHEVNKFTILADVTWTGWSSFQELRISYDNPNQPDTVTTEDWNDTYRFSLGFDYQYSDPLVLRAGLALDESPVPSAERRTVRLPGNDRTWLSLGLTYLFNSDMSMDVGYSHLFVDDAPINNTLESSVPTANSTVTGNYEASVDILSAQFNWNFN